MGKFVRHSGQYSFLQVFFCMYILFNWSVLYLYLWYCVNVFSFLTDGEPLAERLMSARHVTPAAMRHGTESEGTAAHAYSKVYVKYFDVQISF